VSRFASKAELLEEIREERLRLEALLAEIPPEAKLEEVTDGMSVKDFLAHRAEWGRMMIAWYEAAKAGKPVAVPSERFKWNQLDALNAEIHERFADTPLAAVERDFAKVHDRLAAMVEEMSEDELFTKHHFAFTGTSDLATYVNSASAAHYRSAGKHIRKWWKARQASTR